MKKVLVVEDDKNIVELLTIHLKDLDCEVDIAFDGKEGLMKILNNSYHLIILDLLLR